MDRHFPPFFLEDDPEIHPNVAASDPIGLVNHSPHVDGTGVWPCWLPLLPYVCRCGPLPQTRYSHVSLCLRLCFAGEPR